MKILVLGGGFAGRLLTWFLCKKGADVTLADSGDPNSATRVSAGIIKPVTGRRIVKTANSGEAIPFAFNTYREISESSGIEILRDKPVLQLFTSAGNRNDWMARSAESDMAGAIREFIGADTTGTELSAPFGGAILNHSGFAEPHSFQQAIDLGLKNKCEIIHSAGSNEMPVSDGDVVRFADQIFDLVVLCQGPQAVHVPFTGWIPFKPVKGEILDVTIKGLIDDYILSSGIYVVPYGNGRFRVGSTYEWDELNCLPTENARSVLFNSLSEMVSLPIEVTGQKAGIRPAIADRRPVIGHIPGHKSFGVFNGLGTKGAMLGPYFANQAAEYFLNGRDPDPDVNLLRFAKFYQSP